MAVAAFGGAVAVQVVADGVKLGEGGDFDEAVVVGVVVHAGAAGEVGVGAFVDAGVGGGGGPDAEIVEAADGEAGGEVAYADGVAAGGAG